MNILRWGTMTRNYVVAALLAAWVGAPALGAQTVRVAGWGSYEGVTGGEDWSSAGAQFTLATARGHAGWVAAEHTGRFGETDLTTRAGGLLHPASRWWLTAEAGTAREPTFMPKNSWEADVTALVTRRASLGLGYRRSNYVVGAVDVVIPHLTVQTRAVSWDLRVFVSRNPSERTDAAFYLRATTALAENASLWVLGGAGRESYLVGAAPTQDVRSLETVTGAAGLRHSVGSGFTLRLDATVIRSRPVLSRRGVSIGIERSF